MIPKTLDDIWEALRPAGEPIFQRIDDLHPLDWYLGREITGERLLILLSHEEPPEFPQGQSINIVILKRNDGAWSIIFKLVREELKKIFSQLCEDLIDSSRECLDTSVGASFTHNRYLRWKKLLEKGFSEVLDEQSLRGLVGELLFLDQLITMYGASVSLESWLGPSGADQDFRFSDRWYEVKTVRPGAQSITISSIEQLDLPMYSGELIVIYLDKTSSNELGSFNPIDLANEIRKKITNNNDALELFESILEGYGFFLLNDYHQYYFILRQIRHFHVSENFPIIKRKDLHLGINSVKYEISLSVLSSFEL